MRDGCPIPVPQDGVVHVWDSETGHIVEQLAGHVATAYNAVWNPHQSLLARYLRPRRRMDPVT